MNDETRAVDAATGTIADAVKNCLEAVTSYIPDCDRTDTIAIEALLEELASIAADTATATITARLDECHKLRDAMIRQLASNVDISDRAGKGGRA